MERIVGYCKDCGCEIYEARFFPFGEWSLYGIRYKDKSLHCYQCRKLFLERIRCDKI